VDGFHIDIIRHNLLIEIQTANFSSQRRKLKTLIERISCTNEENGYTIAKLKVYGQQDLVTIVGNLMAPTPGEIIKIKGEWAYHPKYGEQFRTVRYQSTNPKALNIPP